MFNYTITCYNGIYKWQLINGDDIGVIDESTAQGIIQKQLNITNGCDIVNVLTYTNGTRGGITIKNIDNASTQLHPGNLNVIFLAIVLIYLLKTIIK
jgi:hypothetical protein